MPRRKRAYPPPRGAATDLGSTAVRKLLRTYTTAQIGAVIGVHSTQVGRYTYGSRPSPTTAAAMARHWPDAITADVVASWGYDLDEILAG